MAVDVNLSSYFAERSTDNAFLVMYAESKGLSPLSQHFWWLRMKHCLVYLFTLADAINDQPSVLEEVLHSRSCSISLFLWVSNVSPNW